MTENALYKELLRPDTLLAGWHLAHNDSRDDFVVDPFGHEDFTNNLTQRLAFIVREVKQGRYRPHHLIQTDVPKSGYSVRPGDMLPIEESALLHSIAYVLAPRLDSRLSDSVHSYRLHKEWRKRVARGRSLFQESDDEIPFLKGKTIRRLDPIESWYQAWPEFEEVRLGLIRKKNYTFLTNTDIAAYFENIDLAVLDSILRRFLPQEPLLLSLLFRLLDSWTRSTSTGIPVGRGIPQGNDVSSFLGNLYLIPLDQALSRFCKKRNATWIRYVDDVEVYSRDANTAREVIPVINGALRALYLNLQGSKTEIIEEPELSRRLASSAQATIDEVCAQLQELKSSDPKYSGRASALLKRVQPLARQFRVRLPKSVHKLNKHDNRLFRRILTAYGSAGRAYMRASALAALTEPPDARVLKKCCRYLEQLPAKYHDDAVDRILEVIGATPTLIPYHVATLLDTLRRLHPTVARLNMAYEITSLKYRQRADWLVRQKTLELLAVLPATEATALKRANNSLMHHHPFVRRAAMLMLARADVKNFRTVLPLLLNDPDPPIYRLALHWHRHLQSKEMALRALAAVTNRPATDHLFLFGLHWLYVLRHHEDRSVVVAVWNAAERHAQSRSAKVQWHLRYLSTATKWARA